MLSVRYGTPTASPEKKARIVCSAREERQKCGAIKRKVMKRVGSDCKRGPGHPLSASLRTSFPSLGRMMYSVRPCPAKTAAEESVGCGIGEMERMAHYHNSNTANNQGENDGETAESGMQRRMSTYEDKWRERERVWDEQK
ncbi:hypothetical protein QQF64_015504 [Cirrhinus molitorella]|uniref:Uncharacterized protein n=1 Tax=Cirrhinus molitorella TaxID=172907 RepID=A0ABR3NV42_9TELE